MRWRKWEVEKDGKKGLGEGCRCLWRRNGDLLAVDNIYPVNGPWAAETHADDQIQSICAAHGRTITDHSGETARLDVFHDFHRVNSWTKRVSST